MKPADFEYVAPDHLDAALGMLASRPSETRVLAGGQSLLPLLKARLVSPATLIDLGRIEDLDRIELRNRALQLGAMIERTGPIFTLADVSDPPLPIPMYALAGGKVRYVGEAVAAVVATSREVAEDACRRLVVDYEPLPPIPTIEVATAPTAPLIHEGLGSNVIMRRKLEWGDAAAAFDSAGHIVRRTMRWGRHSGTALDTFGVVTGAASTRSWGIRSTYLSSRWTSKPVW